MIVKYTAIGLLIYAAMLGYLLAFILSIIRMKRLGKSLYILGFIFAAAAFVYRWAEVEHVPMQRLFDVFLCMGLIYPLSLFCRRFLRVGAEPADMLIGVIVLFPAGFILGAEPVLLPPALQSWLFGPHVAVYLLAYIIMAKASVQAILQLTGKKIGSDVMFISYEQGTYRLVRMGFLLLTVGLLLGSYWGKMAWGDYWGWDPKEMWSLATWLLYVGYFHFRYLSRSKYPHINSIWTLAGFAGIIITLLWANLSRIFAGLHNYAT
ncbi:MAG: cytochrome c biogenesis protein CcsA [Planctomycetota bacterium]|jgi:ABC-type transport system involved in cytochrome c biogenesis permease subunit